MDETKIDKIIAAKAFKRRIFQEIHLAHKQNLIQCQKELKRSPTQNEAEMAAEAAALIHTIAELRKNLASEAYRNVLADLVAFTGFDADEVCFRAAKKIICGFGARGWFNEEYDFFSPRNPAEYAWYYRASQVYVFTNSRKKWWGLINELKPEHQPVLDYGAGIGQNILELYYRGFRDCWFFEIGALQANFFRFRMQRHGFEPQVINPYHEGKFDSIHCIPKSKSFGAIVLQDILEHVPNYEGLLVHLCDCLRPGGIIIEHSPFATVQKTDGIYPHMHLADTVGLRKIMAREKMKILKIFPQDGKAKSEIRIWEKS